MTNEKYCIGRPEHISPELARTIDDTILVEFYNTGKVSLPEAAQKQSLHGMYVLNSSLLTRLQPDWGRISFETMGFLDEPYGCVTGIEQQGGYIIEYNSFRNGASISFLITPEAEGNMKHKVEKNKQPSRYGLKEKKEFPIVIPPGWSMSVIHQVMRGLASKRVTDFKIRDGPARDAPLEVELPELEKFAQEGWHLPYENLRLYNEK